MLALQIGVIFFVIGLCNFTYSTSSESIHNKKIVLVFSRCSRCARQSTIDMSKNSDQKEMGWTRCEKYRISNISSAECNHSSHGHTTMQYQIEMWQCAIEHTKL